MGSGVSKRARVEIEPPLVDVEPAPIMRSVAPRKEWRRFAEAERLLRGAAIALLDAHWIVRHCKEGGTVQTSISSLPVEATMPIGLLVDSESWRSLRLALLSYTWMKSDRDFETHELSGLRKVLEMYVAEPGGTWGVFWRFSDPRQPETSKHSAEATLFRMLQQWGADLYRRERSHASVMAANPLPPPVR